MTKIPGLSPVKTRLATTHGTAFAEGLYTCFLRDIVAKVSTLDVDFTIVYSPLLAAKSYVQHCCGIHTPTAIEFEPQVGNDLGERMHQAFVSAFAKGYERVLLMGGDSPDLPPAYLKAAMEALTSHQGAIIPSRDGGYCLIGFQQAGYAPQLFNVEHWGSPSVLSDTLAQVHREQIDLWQGPLWQDVDDATDLQRFWELHEEPQAQTTDWFQSSQSLKYLRQHERQNRA